MFLKKSCKWKRILAGLTFGIGLGMLLILILPPIAWLCIISIALIITGIKKILER